MTDPSTDRERLVEHAYKDSRPLLAHGTSTGTSAIRFDHPRGSSDRSSGPPGRVRSTSAAVPVSISRSSREIAPVGGRTSAWTCRSAWPPRQAPRTDVVVADAQALPFDDDAFDVVIAAHMLYHVPDADVARRRVRRASSGPTGHALVVLNSARTSRESRCSCSRSLRELAGRRLPSCPRSTERVTIETAAPVVAPSFDVLRCATHPTRCSRSRSRNRSSTTSTACELVLASVPATRRHVVSGSWSTSRHASKRRSPPTASGATPKRRRLLRLPAAIRRAARRDQRRAIDARIGAPHVETGHDRGRILGPFVGSSRARASLRGPDRDRASSSSVAEDPALLGECLGAAVVEDRSISGSVVTRIALGDARAAPTSRATRSPKSAFDEQRTATVVIGVVARA